MKKFIKSYLWALWLGLWLGAFCHLNIFDWQFWAMLIPAVILVAWSKDEPLAKI
jgi:hypothetical protein